MTKRCEICGKEFETRPSFVKRGGGKYCSRGCFYSSIERESRPYGSTRISLSKQTGKKRRLIKVEPEHKSPSVSKEGWEMNARYVVEKHLGRYLKTEEHVHHKDRDTLNDSIDNLEVLSAEEHSRIHIEDAHKTVRKKKALRDFEKRLIQLNRAGEREYDCGSYRTWNSEGTKRFPEIGEASERALYIIDLLKKVRQTV